MEEDDENDDDDDEPILGIEKDEDVKDEDVHNEKREP